MESLYDHEVVWSHCCDWQEWYLARGLDKVSLLQLMAEWAARILATKREDGMWGVRSARMCWIVVMLQSGARHSLHVCGVCGGPAADEVRRKHLWSCSGASMEQPPAAGGHRPTAMYASLGRSLAVSVVVSVLCVASSMCVVRGRWSGRECRGSRLLGDQDQSRQSRRLDFLSLR